MLRIKYSSMFKTLCIFLHKILFSEKKLKLTIFTNNIISAIDAKEL